MIHTILLKRILFSVLIFILMVTVAGAEVAAKPHARDPFTREETVTTRVPVSEGYSSQMSGEKAAIGQATPDFYVTGENIVDMSLTTNGATVLWVNNSSFCADEFVAPCRIRRSPANLRRAAVSTVYEDSSSSQSNAVSSKNIASDDRYVYWLSNHQVLRRHIFDDNSVPPTPLANLEVAGLGSEIAVDDHYVYWTENVADDSAGRLFRVVKSGGTRKVVAQGTTSGLHQLQADLQGGIWYTTDLPPFLPDTLHKAVPLGETFFVTNTAYAFVQSYTFDANKIYLISGLDNQNLRLGSVPINRPREFTHGAFVAFTDAIIPTMAASEDHLYWFRQNTGADDFIYRLSKGEFSSGTAETISTTIPGVQELLTNGHYLFGRRNTDIFRLPLDTPPLQADVSVQSMEVTQGIQTANNAIRLVQDKPTTVRVYPSLNSSTIGGPINATVRLYGKGPDTSNLPGSPLPAQLIQVDSTGVDRNVLADTANFALPHSWLTGGITLKAEIKTVGIADPNTGNDSQESSFAFLPKTHVCIKFLPIQTTSRLTYRVYSPSSGSVTPGFHDILNRFETLWPVPELRYYTQYPTLRKPGFLVNNPQPFNMVGAADGDHVIGALWEHNVFDSAPSWCGGDNARTHYVAMLHPAIDTTIPSVGTRLGQGSFGEPLSWIKMTTDGGPFHRPRAGETLAHELVHNYNNLFGTENPVQHVNCGLGAGSDFDETYPYDSTSIGSRGGVIVPQAGWGYDHISREVIRPDEANDYMSYCSPKWTSDYRWNVVMNKLQNRPSSSSSLQQVASEAQTTEVLTLFGLIDADETKGELLSVYRVPADISVPSTFSQGSGDHGTKSDYQLELIATDGTLLASYPVFPTIHGEDIPGSGGSFHFYTTVPYVTGTSRFQIVKKDGPLILQHEVSANAPVVTITRPKSGDTIADELTVAWQAEDADGDNLYYIVQYSSDGGATWSVIGSHLEETQLTLPNTVDLAGSTQARVRVIASDGVNIGTATSDLFSLTNHPPHVTISPSPGGKSWSILEPVILEARATDPEEGPLADNAVSWKLDGPVSTTHSGSQFIQADLPPGTYTVQVTATDSEGLSSTATSSLVVASKRIFDGDQPTLDGSCDDSAYTADLEPITLRYAEAEPGVVKFVRSNRRLYACFGRLQSIASPAQQAVTMRFDLDNGAEDTLQPGDWAIELQQDGSLQILQVLDGHFVQASLPDGVNAAVFENDTHWSAEIEIAENLLQGWKHLARIQVAHLNQTTGLEVVWPYMSTTDSPATWALTAFGQQAQTIDFPSVADQSLDAEFFRPSVSSSSGLPVTLSSETPAVCEVGLYYVTLLAPGVCSLTASQAGNYSFFSAESVSRQFTVQEITIKNIYLPLIMR